MNGIHDMGGMHGYGPVDPSEASPFHDDWERRVFGLTLAASRHLRSNLDRGRFELEILPPSEYLQGYFERWFARLLKAGKAAGLVDAAALAAIERGAAPPSIPRDHEPLPAAALLHVARSGRPTEREPSTEAAFAIGDSVRARNLHPATHTRLPGYVRGKTGAVVGYRGVHVFPDSHAEMKGEDPRHLYAVRFPATTLWGADAPARDSVTLDLWEPYLEAASATLRSRWKFRWRETSTVKTPRSASENTAFGDISLLLTHIAACRLLRKHGPGARSAKPDDASCFFRLTKDAVRPFRHVQSSRRPESTPAPPFVRTPGAPLPLSPHGPFS